MNAYDDQLHDQHLVRKTLSGNRISGFLDIPITTIESRLHKARRQLHRPKVRKILENLLHTPIEILEKGRKRMPKVEVRLGTDLIPMCKTDSEAENLLDQISTLRNRFLKEKQLTIPPVRVRDNMAFPPRAFRIEIENEVVFRGELLEEEFADTIVEKLADSVQAQAEAFR